MNCTIWGFGMETSRGKSGSIPLKIYKAPPPPPKNKVKRDNGFAIQQQQQQQQQQRFPILLIRLKILQCNVFSITNLKRATGFGIRASDFCQWAII